MKTFIRYLFACALLFLSAISLHAQTFFSVGNNASVFIQAKANVSFDSFVLTPSTDVLLTATDITKSTTLLHTATGIHINRVYQFSQPVANYSGTIAVGYKDNELNGLDENTLVLNAFTNNSWTAFTNSVSHDATNNYVTTSGLSDISLDELTLTCITGVLPLQWISVNATYSNSSAIISWVAAKETNCKYYQVQKSTDAATWQNVGNTVKANNGAGFNYYSLNDGAYLNGTVYYRIVLVEATGRMSYSVVVSVKDAGENTVVVYPNPATDVVHVRVGGNSIIKRVKVFDAAGKLLMVREGSNSNVYSFDVSRFASGFYMMSIETNNGRFSKGFMK